jgi:hypothetical protein
MLNIFLEKILPILLFFLLGYFLKVRGIFSKQDGGTFLKLIFYVLLPSVTLLSVGNTQITKDLALYPLLAMMMHVITFSLGKFIPRFITLTEKEKKVLRGGIMIMNMSFILPFFIMFYGETEIYRYALFDSGNLVVISTVVYYIFMGSNEDNFKDKLKVIFTSPLILALILGMTINFFKIKIPIFLEISLKETVKISGPLIMIALGTYFEPKFKKFKLALSIVTVKMISLLLIGLALGKIFNLHDVVKDILLLAAFSPVGNNILTYTYMSEGDMELATTTVSISIISSFILITLFSINF